ncbi:MAG: TMEM175 family protein [Nocardioidaceae bacterium]
MRTGRLEAFSDGVLAIIITIMVLEVKVPEEPTIGGEHGLAGSATGLLTYLLSFVYVGIYWNNHHHLFQLVRRVTGRVLWANLLLLFSLSLMPFSTAWMDESSLARTPVVVYGVNLLLPALSYYVLYRSILAAEGPDGHVARAITSDVKERGSIVLYAVGIGLAFVAPWLALVPYVAVALWWLVPDRRLEGYIVEHGLAD